MDSLGDTYWTKKVCIYCTFASFSVIVIYNKFYMVFLFRGFFFSTLKVCFGCNIEYCITSSPKNKIDARTVHLLACSFKRPLLKIVESACRGQITKGPLGVSNTGPQDTEDKRTLGSVQHRAPGRREEDEHNF